MRLSQTRRNGASLISHIQNFNSYQERLKDKNASILAPASTRLTPRNQSLDLGRNLHYNFYHWSSSKGTNLPSDLPVNGYRSELHPTKTVDSVIQKPTLLPKINSGIEMRNQTPTVLLSLRQMNENVQNKVTNVYSTPPEGDAAYQSPIKSTRDAAKYRNFLRHLLFWLLALGDVCSATWLLIFILDFWLPRAEGEEGSKKFQAKARRLKRGLKQKCTYKLPKSFKWWCTLFWGIQNYYAQSPDASASWKAAPPKIQQLLGPGQPEEKEVSKYENYHN